MFANLQKLKWSSPHIDTLRQKGKLTKEEGMKCKEECEKKSWGIQTAKLPVMINKD